MSCCSAYVTSPEIADLNLKQANQFEVNRIIASSVQLAPGTYKTDFVVPEMRCASCISKIEHELVKHQLINEARANLSRKTVSIIWNDKSGSPLEIGQLLKSLGFSSHLAETDLVPEHERAESRRLLTALGVSGFAAANIMLLSVSVWSGADEATAKLFHLISGVIAVPAVIIAGQPFFRSALKGLAAKRVNMDFPISLAVILALLMSIYESFIGGRATYFDASVTLLFFLLIGRYLDHLMRQKARTAVERLANLSAKSGMVVSSTGKITQVALNDLKPDMTLRVFAGERFPVNGTIISGTSLLDRSHVTGESEPVASKPGKTVEAGTLNLTGTIDFVATSDAKHSFLSEMQRMMSEAEKGRSTYVRIADRMAEYYTPAVHLFAFIAFTGWMIWTGGDWSLSLYVAISVLIITCPCALGLAVPVAHVIGANRLMKNGIMMRDGTGIERLAEITSVVFDKTGTLTNGRPGVTDCFGAIGKNESILHKMAANSTHPAARAVSDYLGNVELIAELKMTEVTGFGVEATHNGKKARLGKTEWVAEIAAASNKAIQPHSVSFAVAGENPVHFNTSDSLRAGAHHSVSSLKDLGLELAIVSGDTQERVSEVGKAMDISKIEYRQTPEQKIAIVEAAKRQGKKVLMVGDGINDGPALAAGHASMVPATASDVGRQASDFVFTRPSLNAVPVAIKTARLTDKIVRQNFAIAIAYNCIAVPLAMAGMVTPLVAALAMSTSSIVVVANSFRINGRDDGVENHNDRTNTFGLQKEAMQAS